MKQYKYLKMAIWALTILWMAVIFYFSHQPAEVSKEESGKVLIQMDLITEKDISVEGDRRIFLLQYYIRKTAHVTVFFVLGSLLALSINGNRLKGFKAYAAAYLSGTLYAVSDEVHQIFIPGRGPLVKDVMLDSIGVFIGVLITALLIELIRYIRFKRKRSYNAENVV